MTVENLIELLQSFDPQQHIYLNIEKNIEDAFTVVAADTCNVLIVPNFSYDMLKETQEFSFIED